MADQDSPLLHHSHSGGGGGERYLAANSSLSPTDQHAQSANGAGLARKSPAAEESAAAPSLCSSVNMDALASPSGSPGAAANSSISPRDTPPESPVSPGIRPLVTPHTHVSFFATTRQYKLQWMSFFLLGCINNLAYVVVNSAAKSIAESFNSGDLIGAVVWANVGFGIGVRFLNTFALLHTPVTSRMLVNCSMLLLGTLGLAGATSISFWLCLAAVVLVGCFSSLGESVLLGFLRDFDPQLMGAWSSGTGMAGILGTLTYLLLFSVLKLSNRTIFILQAPFVVVYYLAYRYVASTHKHAHHGHGHGHGAAAAAGAAGGDSFAVATDHSGEGDRTAIQIKMRPASSSHSGTSSGADPDSEGEPLKRTKSPIGGSGASANLSLLHHEGSPCPGEHGAADDSTATRRRGESLTADGQVHRRVSVDNVTWEEDVDAAAEAEEEEEGTGVGGAYESLEEQQRYAAESGLVRSGRVLRAVLSPCLQLSLVYFLEYVVLVGFASKANPHADKSDWWATNAYELLALCYQIGVFFARSSVSIIQIRRIELLTLAQAAQFVLWFIHATHQFLPLWLQLLDMIVVGLLGGAMYVNVFYLLVKEKRLRKADQELGINFVAIGINIGIVASSIFEIILFATLLK